MRARNIKPGFFNDEELLELPPLTRLLFAGLWCLADREGRLPDKPKRIKIEVLPCDDCDVDAALESLHKCGRILRYEADGHRYIQVENFLKHQKPHPKEVPSTIPTPTKVIPGSYLGDTQPIPRCGSTGRIPDSGYLIPDSGSRIPESSGSCGSNARDDWNPFGDAPESPPDTVEAYIAAHLAVVTDGIVSEVQAFQDAGMQPDAIRYAVDQAAAQGKRTWAYVKGILRRWEQAGIFTAGAARAAEEQRKPRKKDDRSDWFFDT